MSNEVLLSSLPEKLRQALETSERRSSDVRGNGGDDEFALVSAVGQLVDYWYKFASCRSLRIVAAGFELDASLAEWERARPDWRAAWKPLQALWGFLLDSAIAALRAAATSLTPQFTEFIQLLTLAVHVLPALRQVALSGGLENQRWQHACGALLADGEDIDTTGEQTWMYRLRKLHQLVCTASRRAASMPRTLILLRLRQLETGLRSVPTLDDPMSLFIHTGRCVLEPWPSSPNPSLDTDHVARMCSQAHLEWGRFEAHDCSILHEPIASLTQTTGFLRAVLSGTTLTAMEHAARQTLVLISGLYRLHFTTTSAIHTAADASTCHMIAAQALGQRWEARSAFAFMLADLLGTSRGTLPVPEWLVNALCFGTHASVNSTLLLPEEGSIAGLLQYGDEEQTARAKHLRFSKELLEWGCSVAKKDGSQWVRDGCDLVASGMVGTSAFALDELLARHLAPVASLLQASGLEDSTSGCRGLLHRAMQGSGAASTSDAAGTTNDNGQACEAMVAVAIGAATAMSNGLAAVFQSVSLEVTSNAEELVYASLMVESVADSTRQVAKRKNAACIEGLQLVLDYINRYHVEPNEDASWLVTLGAYRNDWPPEIIRLQPPQGTALDRLIPTGASGIFEPPVHHFQTLVGTWNQGYERGHSQWITLEARVLDQVRNAFLRAGPGESQCRGFLETLLSDDDDGVQGGHAQFEVSTRLNNTRWLAMRLEIVEGAWAYLEHMLEDDTVLPRASALGEQNSALRSRLRLVLGLRSRPRHVFYGPHMCYEGQFASEPVRGGRVRSQDAATEAYRRAVWEAANLVMWDEAVARLEAQQLADWNANFHGHECRDAKELAQLKAAQPSIPHAAGNRRRREDDQRRYDEARSSMLSRQLSRLLQEQASWNERQERERREARIILNAALKQHQPFLEWQMRLLRTSLATCVARTLMPAVEDIVPIQDDNDIKYEMLAQFKRSAAHLPFESWADFAVHARSLDALHAWASLADSGAQSSTIVRELGCFLRQKGIAVEYASLEVGQWRSVLHANVWEAVEEVAIVFEEDCVDFPANRAQQPRLALKQSLFWRRRQPLHRVLTGLAARLRYLAQVNVASAASAAMQEINQTLQQQIVKTRKVVCADQRGGGTDRKHGTRHQTEALEGALSLSAALRAMHESILSVLQTSSPCSHNATSRGKDAATQCSIPWLSHGAAPRAMDSSPIAASSTYDGCVQVGTQSDRPWTSHWVAPAGHAMGQSLAQETDPHFALVETLEIGCDLITRMHTALSRIHAPLNIDQSAVRQQEDLNNFTATFRNLLTSVQRSDFVLRALDVSLEEESASEIVLAPPTTGANRSLCFRVHAWVEAANAQVRQSMQATLEHLIVDLRPAHLQPASCVQTSIAPEGQAEADHDEEVIQIQRMVTQCLPASLISVEMTELWNRPRSPSAHIREAALVSAIRVRDVISRVEAGSIAHGAQQARIELAIRQRWSTESDPSIFEILQSDSLEQSSSMVPSDSTTSKVGSSVLPPMAAMKHAIKEVLIECETLVRGCTSADWYLCDLLRRSNEVHRLQAWLTEKPRRALSMGSDSSAASESMNFVTRRSLIEALKVERISDLPHSDCIELVEMLLPDTEEIDVHEWTTRLHDMRTASAASLNEGPRSFTPVHQSLATHHQFRAANMVLNMQTRLQGAMHKATRALRLKYRLASSWSKSQCASLAAEAQASWACLHIPSFIESTGTRLAALNLGNLLERVRLWESVLQGNLQSMTHLDSTGERCRPAPLLNQWPRGKAVALARIRKREAPRLELHPLPAGKSVRSMHCSRSFRPSTESSKLFDQARFSTDLNPLQKHLELVKLTASHRPVQLPSDCSLIVAIEHCKAQRPSRNGSLRGCSEAYVHHTQSLREHIHKVLFPGLVNVKVVVNGGPLSSNAKKVPPKPLQWRAPPKLSSVQASETLQTATRPLSMPTAPRIGAFEVELVLQAPGKESGVDSMVTFGPSVVFSKLETGRWPLHDRLALQIHKHVELLLRKLEALQMQSPRQTPHHASKAGRQRSDLQRCVINAHTVEGGSEERTGWMELRKAAVSAIAQLPPLHIPGCHEVVARFEYCTASRPGRLGSLRGNTRTFALHFEALRELLLMMLPHTRVIANMPEAVQSTAIRRSQSDQSLSVSMAIACPQMVPLSKVGSTMKSRSHSRVEMASHSEVWQWPSLNIAQHRPAPRRFTPRIGAFELTILLSGPSANAQYGPHMVFSKLESGVFPVHEVVIRELHGCIHRYIEEATKPGGSAHTIGGQLLRPSQSAPMDEHGVAR